MLADHQLPNHIALSISARILFTSLFFISGVTHFTDIPYYVSLMPNIIPASEFWIVLSGLVELAGALMILCNWRAKLGGWLLFIFLIPATFAVHGYQMFTEEDELSRLMQQAHTLKGIALMGAALLITQVGAVVRK